MAVEHPAYKRVCKIDIIPDRAVFGWIKAVSLTGVFVVAALLEHNALQAQEIPEIQSLRKIGFRTERQCWSVTEDCAGYLFVATASGVMIYNGFQWQSVNLPLNRVPRALFLGNDCRVYTSGFEAFGYIDFAEDRDPRYMPIGDSLMAGTNEEMWNIYGNNERMIVQSFSDVYVYDYDTLRLLPLRTNVMLGTVIDGAFFIPQIGKGIYQVVGDAFVEVYTIEHPDDEIRVSGMCASRQPGEYVIATEKHGFFIAGDEGVRQVQSPDLDHIAAQQVNAIMKLRSGEFVIGTILNGIYITTDLAHIEFHINKTNGLSDNTVLSLYEDTRGDVWAGLDIGLDRICMSSPVRRYYDRAGILGTIYDTALYYGDLYMATNHGIFRRQVDGEFSLLGQSQGQAWSLGVYQDVLVCGHNNGTYVFDGQDFEQVSSITGGWWMHSVDESAILQSTYTGLVLIHHATDGWTAERLQRGNILIRKFVLAGHTLLGYHQRYGLSIVELSPDYRRVLSAREINHLDGELIPPFVGMFTCDGRIIMYLHGVHYTVRGTDLIKLTDEEADELQTDTVFRKAFDAYRTLLAQGEEFTLENLDHMDLAHMDRCLISKDDGYEITPIQSPLTTLPVEIDYVRLHDKRMNISALQELRPAQRSMTLQLKNLTDRPNQSSLRYLLAHEDTVWRPVPSSGELALHNLKHGDHTLKVQDMYGNEKTLTVFEIPQFWYLSWPGVIVYMALAALCLWLWNWRVKRNMLRRSQLLLAEKERQLEAERIRANNERLQREIRLKSMLLANRAMALVQKNKLLGQMKELVQAEESNNRTYDHVRSRIIRMVDQNTDHEDDWEVFQNNFDEVHEKFTERLLTDHPNLTSGDKRLAAFIRMDLSSKEIAPLLNISIRSVENKRHRLRKKLRLSFGDSLHDYLMRL